MTKRLFLLSLGLWLTGCASVAPLTSETGNRSLKHRIHREVNRSGLTPNLGLRIIDLATGKVLYEFNSDHLFMPASNNKIYTSIAALHFLGPQYRFVTRVYADSTRWRTSSPVLSRLVYRGSGDPDLSLDDLRNLAERLARNFDQIDTLCLDNTLMDTVRLGNGWMWDEGPWWYSAPVDPLTLNDNCIDFFVKPGQPDHPAVIRYRPETTYITFENRTVTVTDTVDFKPWEITRDWAAGQNHFVATGEILADAEPETVYRNIENPTLFTGQVLREYLEASGVRVGVVRVDSLSAGEVPVDSIVSPPLAESIINLLKTSDNLTAELLVKTIGRETGGGKGTWKKGLTAMKVFFHDSVGIDTTAWRIVDGSGMSRYNLTSPRQLTQALQYAYRNFTLAAEFQAALPTGGWDGTLEHRMQDPLFDRRIRAKTGTLSGATALSGYAFSRRGHPAAFSIMMNGYVGSSQPYKHLEDRICYQILKTIR